MNQVRVLQVYYRKLNALRAELGLRELACPIPGHREFDIPIPESIQKGNSRHASSIKVAAKQETGEKFR